jgi:hypothetical protein
MVRKPNLADPDFEPTDEELAGLMRRAFAHIAAADQQRLAEMRDRIAVGQAEARRRLATMRARWK